MVLGATDAFALYRFQISSVVTGGKTPTVDDNENIDEK